MTTTGKTGVAAGGIGAIVLSFVMGYYSDRTPDSEDPIQTHETKEYKTTDIRNKTVIVIHNTGTEVSFDSNAKYHVEGRNWPGIGYWGGITRDGRFEKFNEVDVISYQTKGSNSVTIGIVLQGNMDKTPPTEAQLNTLRILVASLEIVMPDIQKVIGHKDAIKIFGKGTNTNCPGKFLYPYIEELNELVGGNNEITEIINNKEDVVEKLAKRNKDYHISNHPCVSSSVVFSE